MLSHKQLPEDLLLLQPHRPSLGHEEKGDIVGNPFLGGAVSDVYILECENGLLCEHLVQDGAESLDPLLYALLMRGI